MTGLIASAQPAAPAGERFRALLLEQKILQLPGVYNGLSALQAKEAGFMALYLSGAAMSASLGLPDLGLLSIEDVCFFIRQIVRATLLPILVDADTGYGGVLNVMHAVQSFEEAGAAAIHIEDQLTPKKCGHLEEKNLVSADEMVAKIRAAKRASRYMMVIARTDAVAVEGFDSAVQRAKLYLDAGADAIFPEALTTKQMFRDFSARVKAPLLANMTEFGKTPFISAAEFEQIGYRMVMWPVSALRVAAKAHEALYAGIRHNGGTQEMLDQMQTRDELYKTIRYHEYEELSRKILDAHG
jgi:methylisocitrate lyase